MLVFYQAMLMSSLALISIVVNLETQLRRLLQIQLLSSLENKSFGLSYRCLKIIFHVVIQLLLLLMATKSSSWEGKTGKMVGQILVACLSLIQKLTIVCKLSEIAVFSWNFLELNTFPLVTQTNALKLLRTKSWLR